MADEIRVLELRSVRGTGGGPEKTILLGARGVHSADVKVLVCYLRAEDDEVFAVDRRAAAAGVDYVEIPERHSFDRRIWTSLRALVAERHIDIVHGHEYKTDVLAWLLARRAGIVPLATAHGWTGQSARERFVYYPVDKRLLARFPRVIAVSSEIKGELVRHGAREDHVMVILNSIDPAAFRRTDDGSAVRASLGIRADEFVIGGVGRLEPQKRFDLLLEAARSVAATGVRLRVVVVGDGSLDDTLKRDADRLGLADRCLWLGHRDDIARLHHAFDILVQTSDYEGTPNAVLEAMAMETPIVATDAGGTREVALPDVHALIVPCGDVAAIGAAIERVRTQAAETRRRRQAARLRVERELSFESRTRQLEVVYRHLVRQRRNRLGSSAASHA